MLTYSALHPTSTLLQLYFNSTSALLQLYFSSTSALLQLYFSSTSALLQLSFNSLSTPLQLSFNSLSTLFQLHFSSTSSLFQLYFYKLKLAIIYLRISKLNCDWLIQRFWDKTKDKEIALVCGKRRFGLGQKMVKIISTTYNHKNRGFRSP